MTKKSLKSVEESVNKLNDSFKTIKHIENLLARLRPNITGFVDALNVSIDIGGYQYVDEGEHTRWVRYNPTLSERAFLLQLEQKCYEAFKQYLLEQKATLEKEIEKCVVPSIKL